MTKRTRLNVESLESRYAPATLINPNTVTYQDVDGDNVTITFSKPLLTVAALTSVFDFEPPASGFGGNAIPRLLQEIDLTALGDIAATNLSFSVSATPDPVNGGDGLANVGQVIATDIDLRDVTVDGDLGRILCGDDFHFGGALRTLAVQSLGLLGTATGATDLHSIVHGKLKSLEVKTDFVGARLEVIGEGLAGGRIGAIIIGGSLRDAASIGGHITTDMGIGPIEILGDIDGGTIQTSGSIARLTVGGSLRGGPHDHSGFVEGALNIGPVTIGGDIVGGTGNFAGAITCEGTMAFATVGGDVIGGDGILAGRINAGTLTRLRVGGDVIGGAGQGSGSISATENALDVTIAGSLRGGTNNFSGIFTANGVTKSLTIGGDVVGGIAFDSVNLEGSGFVTSGRIVELTIEGSLVAGADNTTGTFRHNGAIRATSDIRKATIGRIDGNSNNPAVIFARGAVFAAARGDVAILKLVVLGDVDNALILAGVGDFGAGHQQNADAQIAQIEVGGDWYASSVAAGAVSVNPFYGDADDLRIVGAGVKDAPTLSSAIKSIVIHGEATGSREPDDFYGIVAENVGLVQADGVTFATTPGNSNDDFFIGTADDFKVHEI